MLTNKVGKRLGGLPSPGLPPEMGRVCPEVYQTAVPSLVVHLFNKEAGESSALTSTWGFQKYSQGRGAFSGGRP